MPYRNTPTSAVDALVFQLNNAARVELGIPGMFARSASGQIYLTPNFINQVGYRTNINVKGMVDRTLEASSSKVIDSLRIMGEAIKFQEDDNRHLLAANRLLAEKMRQRLIFQYGQSVERRKQVPSYARSNRLSGKLRIAISQPDMAVGTATGIQYINQDRLNVEARHWARINFGVQAAPGARRGAARSDPPQRFKLLGNSGRSVGTVGFRAKPRPPMYLPPGFWEFIGGKATGREERVGRVDHSARNKKNNLLPKASFYRRSLARKASGTSSWGQDYGGYARTRNYERRARVQGKTLDRKKSVTSVTRGIRSSRQKFSPTGRDARYPTRGVVATNFMDAGFRALVENADRVYEQMVRDILNEAISVARRAGGKENVVVQASLDPRDLFAVYLQRD